MGAKAKGRGGRGGGEKHIHCLKGPVKVTPNQGAHLLGFLVVSVHISGREGVGADQDATLHLVAKALSPATGSHLGQAGGIRGPVAVFDTVVAGQVCRGLRRRNYVVGGDAVVEAGAAHIHQLAAQGLQLGGSRQHRSLHLGIKALSLEALAHHAHPQTSNRLVKGGDVIGHRGLQAGGIARIRAGDHLQQLGRIRNRGSEWAHLVEGAGKGDQAVAADAAIGGLQSHHSAEGGWLANRPTGIGAKGSDALACSHCGGAATGATTRHPVWIPRVAAGAEG